MSRHAPWPPDYVVGCQELIDMMERFFEWMLSRNYSEFTVVTQRQYLRRFIEWAAVRGITRPAEVTKAIVERYQRFIRAYRKRNGEPLGYKTRNGRLQSIRRWFKWLARNNHVAFNPAADVDGERAESRLPKCVLTAREAEQVLNQPNVKDRLGLRDRAILETFYSTGMRRQELVRLCVGNLDFERGTVMIRLGKGKKDRLIPIGDRAMAWVHRYLNEVRPGLLVGDRAGDVLFLTRRGKPFALSKMTSLVGRYVTAADIGKEGSCHLLRHTMATLMLENGAGIRFIQAMLGHASLQSTEIYTRVSIRKLKEVHTKTHPARSE